MGSKCGEKGKIEREVIWIIAICSQKFDQNFEQKWKNEQKNTQFSENELKKHTWSVSILEGLKMSVLSGLVCTFDEIMSLSGSCGSYLRFVNKKKLKNSGKNSLIFRLLCMTIGYS